MTTNDKALSNVTLEDQLSYRDRVPQGVSYMEDHSLMVMGETEEGDEISFVSTIFRVGGGKDGPWQVEDTFKGQTTFMVMPKGNAAGMQDNDFIGNRSWATDNWTSGEVFKKDDAVVWQLGQRQHICHPPYWELKGEDMGMEFDLRFSGTGTAAYHKGKFADFDANGLAGYEQPVCAEGTIKANGRTFTLKKEKNFGCQEKFMQPAWDLAKVLRGETYYWAWWASESVRIFIYYYPSVGKSYSHVTVDGKAIDFSENGQSNIRMDALEWWIDPKTRMQVPVKWRFSLSSANGVINLDVAAKARTFYSFLSESGATMHYGLHSRSDGQLSLANGATIPLKDMRSYIEHGWCAIPLASGAC